MRTGFSLLELSIVLVIIGLLAGGVMTGQSLIRAAEIRSITTEYTKFSTAFNTFRDKYQALPGDFKNATAFWGKDNTNCAGNTGTAATPGTCNGNGDGAIDAAAADAVTGEMFRLWQQLALAGMIEGTYTGMAGPGTYIAGTDHLPGINAPASKVPTGGWGIRYMPNYTGDGFASAYDYGNLLFFGARTVGYLPANVLIKPEEAWNVDTKLDDGRPTKGKIVATNWPACTTNASMTDTSGVYQLSNSAPICALYFVKAL